MNTKEIINAVAKEIEDKGGIRQVFLVACGGSLVDMYPAKYFPDSEATKLHVGMYTANEFVYATPKTLGRIRWLSSVRTGATRRNPSLRLSLLNSIKRILLR